MKSFVADRRSLISLQPANHFFDRSIPKFSLRLLPSLNEIRPEKSIRPSSWEKSTSWSWKSILRPAEREKPKKNSSIQHSISNYEVSSNILSVEAKIRYPSTPILSEFRSNRSFSSHLPTFDEEEDESIDSSFQSCIDSFRDTSEETSTLSLTSEYEIDLSKSVHQLSKRTRSSFCVLQ